jgi:hypothetical protein
MHKLHIWVEEPLEYIQAATVERLIEELTISLLQGFEDWRILRQLSERRGHKANRRTQEEEQSVVAIHRMAP